MRASGAGGQHVNTTDSAVRIVHLPTNTMVTCMNERSQVQNKASAMLVLRSRLLAAKRLEAQQQEHSSRREQIGKGDRSERIRTYNFNQDRVTDHRIGLSLTGVEAMMRGDLLDFVLDALHKEELLRKLEADDEDGED
mmetsp:Transcript_58996/g.138880  ORF Transcript_58996/g.138880 Transcript_58996/m.138880 type:complete len:138 (-) Transcript_58996:89-502(-)